MSKTCEVGEWVAFDNGLELKVDDLEPFAPTRLDRDHHDGDTYVRFTVHARNRAPGVREAMRAVRRKEDPRRLRTSGELSEAARARLADEHTRERNRALNKARAAVRMRVGARVRVRTGGVPAVRTHDPEQAIVEGLHTVVRRRRTRSATYAFRVPADRLDDVHIVLCPSADDLAQEEVEWTASLDAPPEDLLDDLEVRPDRKAGRGTEPPEDTSAGDPGDAGDGAPADGGHARPASRGNRRQGQRDRKRRQPKSSNGARL